MERALNRQNTAANVAKVVEEILKQPGQESVKAFLSLPHDLDHTHWHHVALPESSLQRAEAENLVRFLIDVGGLLNDTQRAYYTQLTHKLKAGVSVSKTQKPSVPTHGLTSPYDKAVHGAYSQYAQTAELMAKLQKTPKRNPVYETLVHYLSCPPEIRAQSQSNGWQPSHTMAVGMTLLSSQQLVELFQALHHEIHTVWPKFNNY